MERPTAEINRLEKRAEHYEDDGPIARYLDHLERECSRLKSNLEQGQTVTHVVEADEPRCLDNFRLFLEDNKAQIVLDDEIIITTLDARQILEYVATLRGQRDRVELIDKASELLRSLLAEHDNTPTSDPIVERVVSKFRHRSKIGINKYGKMLDRKDLSDLDWMRHLQEELMDATNYAEAAINKMESESEETG